MRRLVAISALFGLGLAALTAVGQPPAAEKKTGEKKAEKKADPAEAAIAAALAHDPDVRMARAKVQLAEAELAKARQAVTVKVITLRATIDEQKRAVEAAQIQVTQAELMVKNRTMTPGELRVGQDRLAAAKAALARSEMELKLITSGGAAVGVGAAEPKADDTNAVPDMVKGFREANPVARQAMLDAARLYFETIDQASAVRGAVPDRIRAALDKKVKLGEKGQKVPLDKALEVFKTEAGLDIPIRGVGDLVVTPVVTSQGEELAVGAWLQLYEDYSGGGRFYVREYGLLFTIKEQAPPNALTLTQFWDLKPAEKPKEGAEKR